MSAQTSSGSIAAGGGTAEVDVTAEPECAWKATTDASWVAELAPASGQGPAKIEVRASPNADPAPRRGTVQIGSADVQIAQDAAPCTFVVAPLTRTVSASGGTSTITVTANGACAWTASSNVPWITIQSGASGSGNGVATIAVAPGTGTSRTGTVVIAGQNVSISQDASKCVYSVAPDTFDVAAAGGTASTSVTAGSADPGCSWAATSSVPWITVDGGTRSASGSVALTVAANSGVSRTGTVTIAGQTVTVNQAAAPAPPPPPPAPACAYSLSGTAQTIDASAAAGAPISVTTTASCNWTAVSNATWLTVTSGASGAGNGSVSFAATNNTGAQRSGTMTIAGQTYTVTQSAAPSTCTYAITPNSVSVDANGATGSTVAVTTTSGCSWTAASNNTWITVTAGASGSGTGTVGYSIAANTGAARTGSITIAGQTFAVSQGTPCTYTINPANQSIGSAGGTGSPVTVTAASACAWTATSNATWITVTGGASGNGNGSVSFSVAANSATARSGTVTIAGQTFTVNQADGCTYQISPSSQAFGKDGGNGGPVTVTAAASCTWTAVSNVPWVSVTGGGSGSGNGTVTFSVASTKVDQTGTITIASQTFTVTQSKN